MQISETYDLIMTKKRSNRMKSRILLVPGFMALTLLSQAANAQLPKQTPARPRAETGTSKPPGTVTGGTQNIVNSKLLIYAKNGLGTLSTNTSGEFPSQLVASATVNKEFSLRWSRPKPGNGEKCNLFVTPQNTTAWVAIQSVSMPAQSTSVDIQFSMPNLGPKTYEMKAVCDSGSSSKVTINYTANNGSAAVAPSGSTASTPVPTAGVKVISARFTPRVGNPNQPDFKEAKLRLTVQAEGEALVKGVSIEVYSAPFTNQEYITASGTKNAPIQLFTGYAKGTYQIHPHDPQVIVIVLYHTAKSQVQGQETGPGLYGPGDWNLAFSQTETASFRWTVNGNQSGAFEQPVKSAWQWTAP
jgi:hypothetical protein